MVARRLATALRCGTLALLPGHFRSLLRAVPSLHITLGVETDTDAWTWLALLIEAAEALHLLEAKEQLQARLPGSEASRQPVIL